MDPVTFAEITQLSDEITQLRKDLHRFISEAHSSVQQALRTMKTLDNLFDVEYEGTGDAKLFLTDAARMLRAAQVIKPTDAEGV